MGASLGRIGAGVTAVDFERVELGALSEVWQCFQQQGFVVGVVGGDLYAGDELQVVFGITGLAEVDDVAPIAFPVFLAVRACF